MEILFSDLDGSLGLLVITDWNEFKTPDFENIKSRMINPLICRCKEYILIG